VASPRAECWLLVPDRYDVADFLVHPDRPALKRCFATSKPQGRCPYWSTKIDGCPVADDFSRRSELFDEHKVYFCFGTQSFQYHYVDGPLTLNSCSPLAHSDVEGIGERIRDKFAASPASEHVMARLGAAGPTMSDRKCSSMRLMPGLFARLFSGSSSRLSHHVWPATHRKNIRNKYGTCIDNGHALHTLNNPVYSRSRPQSLSYPVRHVAPS